MMSTIIVIAALLAFLHFLYEGVLAPTYRLHLRNELFELRDEVRTIMIAEGRQAEDQAFMIVHDAICNALGRLSGLSLSEIARARARLHEDPELARVADERIATVKSSDHERIKEIFQSTNRIVSIAFLTNMGGWFFYLIPIALVVGVMRRLKFLVSELVTLPERLADRLFKEPPSNHFGRA